MIFDFQCAFPHRFEANVSSSIHSLPCKVCSEPAKRLISAPAVHLDPTTGAFPGAALRWAREHERKAIVKED
jgi:hypothetical protein